MEKFKKLRSLKNAINNKKYSLTHSMLLFYDDLLLNKPYEKAKSKSITKIKILKMEFL